MAPVSRWNTEEDLRIFRSSKDHVLGMDLEGRNVTTTRVCTCLCVGQC
jgi:hypothetical protein